MSSWVEIGYVARAHGVRGEIRVQLHDPESADIASVSEVRIGDAAHEVRGARLANKGAVLLQLAGVDDRDAAEAMKGRPVAATRRELGIQPDDVLAVDLIGCRAVLVTGDDYGEVEQVEGGPQLRLIIRQGDVVRQLPLVDQFVLEVDLEHKRVVVDPPDGLPEESAT